MIIALTVGSHNTSFVSCILISSTNVAGSAPAAIFFPVTLKYTAHLGGFIRSAKPSIALFNASWAGCMSEVWKAPEVLMIFACRALAPIAREHNSSTAFRVPAHVKPEGKRTLATFTVAPGAGSAAAARSQSSSRVCRGRPAIEHMACGTSSEARCMASARSFTRRRPSSKVKTPAATSAVYSPSDSPATAWQLSTASSLASLKRSMAAKPAMSIKGWQCLVSAITSSGPLSISCFGSQPKIDSAFLSMSLTKALSMTSLSMPTYCEPWPGKSSATGTVTFTFARGSTFDTGKSNGRSSSQAGGGYANS
mmetsp:Transcript_101579/g.291579  ORF Transcript_101579/g.291579 Transcript_101579/m.291579 type:complete len:309 (-) Transcript_101579:742-1668(-)